MKKEVFEKRLLFFEIKKEILYNINKMIPKKNINML